MAPPVHVFSLFNSTSAGSLSDHDFPISVAFSVTVTVTVRAAVAAVAC